MVCYRVLWHYFENLLWSFYLSTHYNLELNFLPCMFSSTLCSPLSIRGIFGLQLCESKESMQEDNVELKMFTSNILGHAVLKDRLSATVLAVDAWWWVWISRNLFSIFRSVLLVLHITLKRKEGGPFPCSLPQPVLAVLIFFTLLLLEYMGLEFVFKRTQGWRPSLIFHWLELVSQID